MGITAIAICDIACYLTTTFDCVATLYLFAKFLSCEKQNHYRNYYSTLMLI